MTFFEIIEHDINLSLVTHPIVFNDVVDNNGAKELAG